MPSANAQSLGGRMAQGFAAVGKCAAKESDKLARCIDALGQTPAAAVADDLRRLSAELVSQLDRLNVVLAAFQMAAEYEANRSAASEPLYWPDLLDVIGAQVPDAAVFDQRIQSMVETLHAVRPSI